MRSMLTIAALCAALPLAAQDPPNAPTPQDQAKPQTPTLEKPGTAAPEPEAEKPPAQPPPKAAAKSAAKAPAKEAEKAPPEGANPRWWKRSSRA